MTVTTQLRHLRPSFSIILMVIFASLTFTSLSQASSITDRNLLSKPGFTDNPEKVNPSVKSFLKSRSDDKVIVWVMFSDKGVRTDEEFALAASRISLNQNTIKRRTRVDLTQIVFADLPVVTNYVQAIVDLGGKQRTVSKWLNAASFEIGSDKLDELASLSFVSSIRPVSFLKSPIQHDNLKDLPDATALGLEDINYGFSRNQIQQIKADKAHAKGYNGLGVVLSILDTGYRKTHESFATAYSENRVIDEYDFIFDDADVADEPEDQAGQMSHGTSVWGAAGGEMDGVMYGPAYKASFLLAKTEDIRSETPIEEDYWVSAMEWSDSLGADVITTSLGYSDWYTYSDYDGETAVITIAANTAIGLGIVVVNSAANGGPAPGTITPPADAFDIISCGAVDVLGDIASFSSRGPTYDGRIKPEVCARGYSTYVPRHYSDSYYGPRNGTSFSAPIVAGAVCILLQARPDFTPQMIRQALMETADNAQTPDNTYGWGIVNIDSALTWGVYFLADETHGEAPHTVQFTDHSSLNPTTWHWTFGDGTESFDQSPSHTYDTSGIYNVSLTAQTSYGDITTAFEDLIVVSSNTLTFSSDSAYAGHTLMSSLTLTNSLPIEELEISFKTDLNPMDIVLDSVVFGSRTTAFEDLSTIEHNWPKNTWTANLISDNGGGTPPLSAGSGEILKLYFSTDVWAQDELSSVIDTSLGNITTNFKTGQAELYPVVIAAELRTRGIIIGDFNNDQLRDLADITKLISYVYLGGVAPLALPAADCNYNQLIDLSDITNLISFVYIDGDDPDIQ